MAQFVNTATQCTILNDPEDHTPKNVIYSDDKEERSLSSLFNMFGIKYNRVTRSTTESNCSNCSNCSNSPISRGRVLPIDTDLPLNISDSPIGRLSIIDNSLSEYTLMPWQNYEENTPTTPQTYEHPWL